MTITVALGTSTPTSMTVVETRMCTSPRRNASITALFFLAAHAAVQQAQPQFWKNGFLQPLVFDDGGFERAVRFRRFGLLDHGIDDVGLAAGGDLAAQKIPHAGKMFGPGPARLDGRAAGRQTDR